MCVRVFVCVDASPLPPTHPFFPLIDSTSVVIFFFLIFGLILLLKVKTSSLTVTDGP